MSKAVITNGQAKRIAMLYKNQSYALESLYRSGMIRPSIKGEIEKIVQSIPPGRQRRELLALYKYVRVCRIRPMLPGWSDLLPEYTEVTVDQV